MSQKNVWEVVREMLNRCLVLKEGEVRVAMTINAKELQARLESTRIHLLALLATQDVGERMNEMSTIPQEYRMDDSNDKLMEEARKLLDDKMKGASMTVDQLLSALGHPGGGAREAWAGEGSTGGSSGRGAATRSRRWLGLRSLAKEAASGGGVPGEGEGSQGTSGTEEPGAGEGALQGESTRKRLRTAKVGRP
ncbi:unnamed protein product [Discosporangium mesarthrocarpum]